MLSVDQRGKIPIIKLTGELKKKNLAEVNTASRKDKSMFRFGKTGLKRTRTRFGMALMMLALAVGCAQPDGEPEPVESAAVDPLPSWNEGRHIGRRPIAAFGNSDGDLKMLQYATGADGPGLAVLVHHDDAEREYAYDRGSKIGGLDKALDEAEARGWTVVSMRDDWKTIFPSAD